MHVTDKIVEPEKVFIVTPTHDGNVCSGYAGALASSTGLFGGIMFIVGNSNVSMARALQAHVFLQREEFDWLLSIDADIQWRREDLALLYEGDALLRCAEYAKKDMSKGPAQLGMGFTLIHRDVFAALRALTLHYEGKERPIVLPFNWEGRAIDDFFPTGPDAGGKFIGEDHGFFRLVQKAGITPRGETRTRLLHWGRAAYAYERPAANDATLPDVPA